MSTRQFSKPKFRNEFLPGEWIVPAWNSGLLADMNHNRLATILTAIATHLPQPCPGDARLARLVGMSKKGDGSSRTSLTSPLAYLVAAGFIRVAERTRPKGVKVFQLVDARRFEDKEDPIADFLARRIADLNYALEQAGTSAFKSVTCPRACELFMAACPLPDDHWDIYAGPTTRLSASSFEEDDAALTRLSASSRDRTEASTTRSGADAIDTTTRLSASSMGERRRAGIGSSTRQEVSDDALDDERRRAGARATTRSGASQSVLKRNKTKESVLKRGDAPDPVFLSADAEGVEDVNAAEVDAEFDRLADVFPANRRTRREEARQTYYRLRNASQINFKTARQIAAKLVAAEKDKKSPFIPHLTSFLNDGMYRPQIDPSHKPETDYDRAMRLWAHTPDPLVTDRMVGEFAREYRDQHDGRSVAAGLTMEQQDRLSAFIGRSSFTQDNAAWLEAIKLIPRNPLTFIDLHPHRMPSQGLDVVKAIDPDVRDRLFKQLLAEKPQEVGDAA